MFMALGCSVAMEHAVLKIRYNQDYSTKLIEISIVDKKYDFESKHVLNLIFKNFLRLTATLSTYFLNDPRISSGKKIKICLMTDIFLRRNGTPPFDVLPFEINIENYFLLIGVICTLFGNFPRSSVD